MRVSCASSTYDGTRDAFERDAKEWNHIDRWLLLDTGGTVATPLIWSYRRCSSPSRQAVGVNRRLLQASAF
jgi:hypothetical protein